jgi:hypothetical protein
MNYAWSKASLKMNKSLMMAFMSIGSRILSKILLLCAIPSQFQVFFVLLNYACFGHGFTQANMSFVRAIPSFIVDKIKSRFHRTALTFLKMRQVEVVLITLSYVPLVGYSFGFLHPWQDQLYFLEYWRYCLIWVVFVFVTIFCINRITMRGLKHVSNEVDVNSATIKQGDGNLQASSASAPGGHQKFEKAFEQLMRVASTNKRVNIAVLGNCVFMIYKIVAYDNYISNSYYRIPYYVYVHGLQLVMSCIGFWIQLSAGGPQPKGTPPESRRNSSFGKEGQTSKV